MTQHADPRLDTAVAPMIDTSVDAETTTPAGGTRLAPPSGWPPPGAVPHQQGTGQQGTGQQEKRLLGVPPYGPAQPMPVGAAPEAPLNTLSWLSVVTAFVVSPVAIVLGAIARRQIARTGERGKGLATTGLALGIVFTLMGIVSTIMVLSMVTTVTYSPAPVAAEPVPAAAAPIVESPAPSTGAGTAVADGSAGRAQLLAGWLDVAAADATLSENLDAHSGDLDAIKADVAVYRDELQSFRDTAASAQLSPELRAQVDSRLLPAVDTVLGDLDTIVTSSSSSRVQAAASALSDDATTMANEVMAVIGS